MDKLSGPALWINPCGVDGNDDVMPPGTEIPYLSNRDLLNQIIVQAGNALAEAESFKGDYVKKTFKADFKDHHNSWKHSHYDWLPGKKEIPKDLGEEVSMAHLQSIENNLNITLANSYEYLQRFAVGLEQVVSDQRAHSGPFKDHFIKSEFRLRAVLCEIQVAILEHNAERRPDITRAIMDDQYRNGDDSSRNLRDWIIYRDYMNALEYIIEVFKFITSKMSP